jgi:hypothetical protein
MGIVYLYLKVVSAIARSRVDPVRAERIVLDVEKRFHDSGDVDVQPDHVLYGALINAFGWTPDYRNKSFKCHSIYQRMLDLYRSRRNVQAKPDIISCNSLLNACVHDIAETEQDRVKIMEIVVQTLEDVEASAPTFGRPNHVTYALALQAIANHVTDSQVRIDLAEATFWRCCQKSMVSVPVITSLYRALPWERFSSIMGDALQSAGADDPLRFNLRLLPRSWTQYAPRPQERRDSPRQPRRPSAASKPSIARLYKDF